MDKQIAMCPIMIHFLTETGDWYVKSNGCFFNALAWVKEATLWSILCDPAYEALELTPEAELSEMVDAKREDRFLEWMTFICILILACI